ncbi:hypothetical protein [Roseicyclus sp.]
MIAVAGLALGAVAAAVILRGLRAQAAREKRPVPIPVRTDDRERRR